MSEPIRTMNIDVTLQDGYIPIDVTLSTRDNTLDVVFDANAGGRLPYYDGDFDINPTVGGLTLPTKNKSMKENVVVNSIYYSEVLNPSGGETAYIGLVE